MASESEDEANKKRKTSNASSNGENEVNLDFFITENSLYIV